MGKAIGTVCPEPGCGAKTTAWSGHMAVQEWDAERACPAHKKKYETLRDEFRRSRDLLRRACK